MLCCLAQLPIYLPLVLHCHFRCCTAAAAGVPDPSCNANPSSTYCLSVTGIICKYSLKAPGTVCRPRQTGAGYECDVDDTCGTNGCDCPADGYASNTTVCRDASGAVPAQTCTGVSPACPGRVMAANSHCTGMALCGWTKSRCGHTASFSIRPTQYGCFHLASKAA